MSLSMPPAGSFRCTECKLVQFDSPSGTCRRCGAASPNGARDSERAPVPIPVELPALDPPVEPRAFSARDLPSDASADDVSHLVLDLPEATAPRASTVAPSPGARVSVPATPSASPATPVVPHVVREPEALSDTAKLFLERDTGMVRTWLVVTLTLVCALTVLGARGARMVAEQIERASAAP